MELTLDELIGKLVSLKLLNYVKGSEQVLFHIEIQGFTKDYEYITHEVPIIGVEESHTDDDRFVRVHIVIDSDE